MGALEQIDRLTDWLRAHKLPIGARVREGVDWLTSSGQSVFDGIRDGGEFVLDGMVSAGLAIPAPLMILLIAGGAWALHRSWSLSLGVLAGLTLIVNLGLWTETIQTLVLVLNATLWCILIGLPLGIAAARRPWLFQILRPMMDLMQTIPTFVYLIPALILFGLGMVPGLLATMIFALPAMIRLTHLGLVSVPLTLREAGLAFGATPLQLLLKVELPHAAPTLMAGVTQTIMLSLSMVVISALVAADGLGKPVVRALNTTNIALGFEAGLAIVILAILLDRLCRMPARLGGAAAHG